MSHIHGLPTLPKCFNGLITTQRTISESSQGEVHEGETHVLVRSGTEVETVNHDITFDDTEGESSSSDSLPDESPFTRLNRAYDKLKFEMVRIRIVYW